MKDDEVRGNLLAKYIEASPKCEVRTPLSVNLTHALV
jgi:hypothetical protein